MLKNDRNGVTVIDNKTGKELRMENSVGTTYTYTDMPDEQGIITIATEDADEADTSVTVFINKELLADEVEYKDMKELVDNLQKYTNTIADLDIKEIHEALGKIIPVDDAKLNESRMQIREYLQGVTKTAIEHCVPYRIMTVMLSDVEKRIEDGMYVTGEIAQENGKPMKKVAEDYALTTIFISRGEDKHFKVYGDFANIPVLIGMELSEDTKIGFDLLYEFKSSAKELELFADTLENIEEFITNLDAQEKEMLYADTDEDVVVLRDVQEVAE